MKEKNKTKYNWDILFGDFQHEKRYPEYQLYIRGNDSMKVYYDGSVNLDNTPYSFLKLCDVDSEIFISMKEYFLEKYSASMVTEKDIAIKRAEIKLRELGVIEE